MGLGEHLFGHGHGHRAAGDHGNGIMSGGRRYDVLTRIAFLGRRRRTYTALAVASGACKGECVVDIGCGTGAFTTELARSVGATGTVTGIDPSADMMAVARRDAPHVAYVEATAQALPFADGSVDLVASALALHHIAPAERDLAVAEIGRVLRSGGRLLLADFSPPRGRLARVLTLAVTGSRMADSDPVTETRGLCMRAGLVVAAEGRQAPFFAWTLATKPRAR